MLRRLIERFGVDYVQWRALLRAYVMLDYAELFGAYGAKVARDAALRLLLICGVIAIISVEAAIVAWAAADTWMAASVMTLQTAAIVGFVVLMHVQTIVAPDDYAIVGFRPISPRTYLAVRVSAILIHTIEVAALAAYVPVAVWLIRPGGSILQALAAMAAAGGIAFAVTLAIVAAHGWLLRRISPARLTRMMAIVNAVLMLAIVGLISSLWMLSINLGPAGPTFNVFWTLPRTWWVLAAPPTWFAAYVEIARGTAGRLEVTAAALSIAALVALVASLRGRLTADYAVRAAERTLDAPPPVSAGRADPDWSGLAGERRAMAVMLRHAARGDLTTQMNMVTSLMMGAFMVGMSGFIGLPGDPFVGAVEAVMTDGSMLLVAAFLMPISFRHTLALSQHAAAMWPFYAAPADRARLLIATRQIIGVFILLPTILVVIGLSVYAYGHWGHAILNGVFIALVSYLLLQINDWFDPRLPFSTPIAQTTGRKLPFKPMMAGIGIIGVPIQLLLTHVAYRTTTGIVAALVVLGAVVVFLDRGRHERLRTRCEKAGYVT